MSKEKKELLSRGPSSLVIEGHRIQLSNFDKILFPKSGITKGDMVNYYKKIAPYFLAHATDHLIVMHRFPNGIAQEGFYQKQISDYFPSWIQRKKILLHKQEEQTLVVVDSAATLVYLANQAVLVFHSWISTKKRVTKPDKIVFDVDPAGHSLSEIRFALKKLKSILEKLELHPFVMTTGSRSYHVVIPVTPVHTYAQVHAFAKQICQLLVDQYPDRFTIAMNKEKREEKIFLDYLRNSFGQTSVACYSLRALEGGPVATPLAWDELSKTKPQQYTIKNIFKRLARKKDPWRDFAKYARPLPNFVAASSPRLVSP